MWKKRIALGALVAAVGCGGSAPGAKSEASDANLTPGQQCLKTANAPRQLPDQVPAKLALSHILIRHKELRPSEAVDRTREQACLLAQEAREALLSGEEWSAVVKKYSDAGLATNGSLGTVSRDELDEAFGNAAFGLKEQEVSHVVETKRGFHVIIRTP